MKKNELNQHPNFEFNDPTTPKPGSFHELSIYYVPLDRQVSFKAFITDFSDQFQTNWEQEEIYGRMDPVQTFKSTTRNISVGFDVVAASHAEAKFNMAKIGELASMHYPVYKSHGSETGGSATALNQSPLLRVKYMNWICKSGTGGMNGRVKESGLLVASSGFSFEPQMDDLMFTDLASGSLYPKFIKISLNLAVIHEHGMGFDEKGKRVKSFPYNDDGTHAPAIFTKKVDEQIFTEASAEASTEEAFANGTVTKEQVRAMEDKLGLNGPTRTAPSD